MTQAGPRASSTTTAPTAPTRRQAGLGLPDDELLAEEEFRPNAVDAIVFDVGNVLLRWDPAAAIAAAVGRERAERFLQDAEFDFAAWNLEQDRGRDWAEAEDLAVAAFPGYAQEIRAYRANFAAALTGRIADSVAVLRELHELGVPLFALTNFSAELFAVALDGHDFFDVFEDIVVSGEEGVVKPDPEIFEELESRMRHIGGLDDAVFVDDSAANVLAAEAAGMDAILFTDSGHLREDLRARGLPLTPG